MSKYVDLLSTYLCLIWMSVNITSGQFPGSNSSSVNKQFNVDVVDEWHLEQWLSKDINLGQVSGVSIDPDDNIYLFHRADRVWDENSFNNSNNVYNQQNLGAIKLPTILIFNKEGTLINQLGKNMFFLPHGITVDSEFNIWVTDVALHQVMKLVPSSNSVSLVLGEKFIPGNGLHHFCKPTSVAVVSNGDFFVADGYCNSRILKYNSKGKKILEWGRATSYYHPPGKYDLNIPHALTLAEDWGAICTADRENGRVVCYHIDTGEYITQLSSSVIGSKIFSVAYSSILDGRFFIVNGKSEDQNLPVQGIVLNPIGKIVGKFGSNLHTPHDLAVASNGNAIYVVEIGPYKAWKYIKKDCNTVPDPVGNDSFRADMYQKSVDNVEGLTGAVLVTIGCFVFAIGLIMAVLIYSKSRKASSSDTRRLLQNINY